MNPRLTITMLVALTASSGCLQELPDGSNLVGLAEDPGSPSGSAPTTSSVFFRPDVQQDLQELGCAVGACHGGGALPMELVEAPQADIEWTSNYEQVVARCVGATPSLLGKALGDGGHVQALAAGDPVVARWEAWIEAGMPFDAGSTGGGGQGPGPGPGPGTGGGEPAEGVSWTQDIGPLLAGLGCVTCHGPQDVQAGYSLASYDGALGMGSDDVPNVIPGEAGSLLVLKTEEGHGDITYADTLLVLTWIVDWQAQE